jgi:CRP/FNR family cyclic AMP-dependent transcriptional regulator
MTGTGNLSRIALLEGVPAATLDLLARRCRWLRVPTRRPVVDHLDRSTEVFFLVSGAVRVTLYSAAGREVAFRDLRAGDFFGELSAIDGEPRSASAVALTESQLAALSADGFRELLRDHPEVAERVMRRLTRLIRLLTERVLEFSTLNVPNRVHAELLRLARERGPIDNRAVIVPAPTHADIAHRISTHREAVTRELNRLARAGILERRPGTLVIRDFDRLQALVEEDAGLAS